MNGRFLLDTNIIIALFAGEDSVIQALTDDTEVFVPAIVLGELYYGAQGSNYVEDNLERIGELRASSAVLSCDADTALIYGQVKIILKRNGRPIPENDIWICSLALQHRLTLVSRDKHFRHIEGLTLTQW